MSAASFGLESSTDFAILRRRALFKILVITFLLTAFVIGVFFGVNHAHFREQAEAYASSIRPFILIDDLVSVTQQCKQSLMTFDAVKIELLRVGKTLSFGDIGGVQIELSEAIVPGPGGRPLARLTFFYDPTPLLFMGSAMLCILFCCLYFLFKNYEKHLMERWQLSSGLLSSRVKNDMARQLAHDIRSPVQALETAVHLIQTGRGADINLIRAASDRINSIAADLLKIELRESTPVNSVSPEQAGATLSTQDFVPLYRILDDILQEKRMQNSQIKFGLHANQLEAGHICPEWKVPLQRILSNLINNSIEASATKIDVSYTSREGLLTLSVLDDGLGMSDEFQREIRTKSISSKPQGHGLGLSGARRFAAQQGGRVDIFSRLGLGAQINLILPTQSQFSHSSISPPL
jgi:signal transduction histidine kinase